VEFESFEIKELSRLRIGAQIHLKTSIKKKAIDLVCANAAPDSIAGFKYLNRDSRFVKSHSACQPRESGANNEDRKRRGVRHGD